MASTVEEDARVKARVMVEHYMAAQQMNTSLQKQIADVQEAAAAQAAVFSAREEEMQAVMRKLHAAEADVQSLQVQQLQQPLERQQPQAQHLDRALQLRVQQLETENARLREMSLGIDSEGPALRAQNAALKEKLKEKKQTISSLVCGVCSLEWGWGGVGIEINSGAHSRVATLIQPSFQIKKKKE